MTRHIVATVDEIPPGQRRLVNVNGRDIGIFNVDGEYFAVSNRCPHEGASLCKGRIVGLVEAAYFINLAFAVLFVFVQGTK